MDRTKTTNIFFYLDVILSFRKLCILVHVIYNNMFLILFTYFMQRFLLLLIRDFAVLSFKNKHFWIKSSSCPGVVGAGGPPMSQLPGAPRVFRNAPVNITSTTTLWVKNGSTELLQTFCLIFIQSLLQSIDNESLCPSLTQVLITLISKLKNDLLFSLIVIFRAFDSLEWTHIFGLV